MASPIMSRGIKLAENLLQTWQCQNQNRDLQRGFDSNEAHRNDFYEFNNDPQAEELTGTLVNSRTDSLSDLK